MTYPQSFPEFSKPRLVLRPDNVKYWGGSMSKTLVENPRHLTYDGKEQDRDKILYFFDERDRKAVIVGNDESRQETT